MSQKRWGIRGVAFGSLVVGLLLVGGAIAVWSLSSVEHVAAGAERTTLVIDTDFDKFRQIMVRKNATGSILALSGMTLVDEQLEDLRLDASQDRRPLLNAILGKSATDLSAVKQIKVKLDDPELDADILVLQQQVDIRADSMSAVTQAKRPAGKLEAYETSLLATRDGNHTKVELALKMKVRVQVPKVFVARADEKVRQAAREAILGQAQALEAFISEHQGERLVLPELK
ncbi:hypothetical protein [Aureliella helgolandensis]|uniref:Uncharacterized protein n=1 Tax=Aureliella helgolandensis TaxID=2527968 RepID=A0A518GFX6_9BACT|nr:hypothetical protein [Aureliella helgolandensis]QDV27448.1 hypothetical protein Q31a_58370 [Aureliella helgolandensis]